MIFFWPSALGSAHRADTQGSEKVCREKSSPCDLLEVCTGTAADCPADKKVDEGATCDDNDKCTRDDKCTADSKCEGTFVCECKVREDCFPGIVLVVWRPPKKKKSMFKLNIYFSICLSI